MQINLTWIRLWTTCLSLNENFLSYCLAKRNNELKLCVELGRKNDIVAELYEDFGDVYIDIEKFSNSRFKIWLRTKRDLFFSEPPTVFQIKNLKEHPHVPGHVLLDIELSEDIEATLAQVHRLLTSAYLPEISYRLHTGKHGMLPLKPLAKYSLHGDCTMATLGRVNKAITAMTTQLRAGVAGAKPLSISETILAIKKQKNNPFGWVMTKSDLIAERRGTFKKAYDGSSEKALILRHRKDSQALVRNVLHGRFPDFT